MKKTRSPYIFSYFFTALLIIQSYSCSTDKNKKSPPNLIVFIADDVSWDDLGCYGNEYVQSPNIDLLAKDGIVFKLSLIHI